MRRAADGAVFAITFLTIVPLPMRDGRGAASAPAWFGLVGLLVGAVGAALYAVAAPVLGHPAAAALGVVAMVVVTGGLHHDGLADCADGLGVRGGRDRRLAVMREPAVGTYGSLALISWLLLMATSLAGLDSREAPWALVCAAGAGRLAALLHARWTPPARRDGLGAGFAPSWPAVLVTAATTIAVTAALFELRTAGVIASAGLSAAVVGTWARRTLGGRTGDTLGATVLLTELGVVLALLGSAQAT